MHLNEDYRVYTIEFAILKVVIAMDLRLPLLQIDSKYRPMTNDNVMFDGITLQLYIDEESKCNMFHAWYRRISSCYLIAIMRVLWKNKSSAFKRHTKIGNK